LACKVYIFSDEHKIDTIWAWEKGENPDLRSEKRRPQLKNYNCKKQGTLS